MAGQADRGVRGLGVGSRSPQMSGWIDLDPEALDERLDIKVRDMTIQVLVSPYSVPQAIRARLDRSRHRWIVEFRYLSIESTHPVRLGSYVTLHVGRATRRLYSIEIEDDKGAPKDIRVATKLVEEAIDQISSGEEERSALANYRLAKRALQHARGRLFSTADSAAD